MHPKKIYDIFQYMQSNFFSAIRSLFDTHRKDVCHGNPSRQSRVNSVLFLFRQFDVAILSPLRVALICLLMCLGVGSAWGTTSYKLTAVDSVSAGKKYVFVRDSKALINNVTSNSVQTTSSYNTSGLSGTENYIWVLYSAKKGYYLKFNIADYYLNNALSTADMSFGETATSIWSITFTDGIALISNTSNSNRFLGETSNGSGKYKAYATSNLNNYSHDFTVYRLDEEVSVHHVAIEGRWDRFGGETISLTATAYASEGSDLPIDAADINSFQWQKYYNSTWNDIDTEANPSAATPNLVIENCSSENSGSYRCVASTNPTPSVASNGLQVKVFTLECYTGGTAVYNFTRVGETQAGILQIDLAANTSYQFKFHADINYYGNSGTINEDVSNWVCSTAQGNLTIASGLGGTFTIEMEYSSGGSSSVEGEPEISVTYPRKTIFLQPGVWNSEGAKFALYYFRKEGETTYGTGWTDFMTQFPCSTNYYVATIPQWNGVKINAVRLNSDATEGTWDKKWNQTSDITITSNDLVTITGWDKSQTYNSSFSVPTYSISFAGGSGSSGSMDAIDEIACDAEQELPACGFSKTGYDFANWTADVAVVVEAETIEAGDVINDAVTLQNIRGDISLTAVWNPIAYNLTYEGLEGATNSNPASYTIETTTFSLANPGSRTGYTFTGWTCGGEAITEIPLGSTGDKTITANWTHDNYSVTWSVNGAVYSAGVDSENDNAYYGDKISKMPSQPADNTLVSCANKFMGWSTTEIGSTPVTDAEEIAALELFTDVEGSPAITANTTFYAVFAEQSSPDANTVIWSEDFSSYASQNVPSGSVTTATGRVVYNDGSVTYSCANSDNKSETKVQTNNLAGGTSPELMVGYGGTLSGYFNVSNIPNLGAENLELTYKQNGYRLQVDIVGTGFAFNTGETYVSSNVEGTRTHTINCGTSNNFSLYFRGPTTGSSNVRLDDIELKIKTPGYTNYVTQCAPEPQITISGDIHLTSVKDVYVYATNAASNLLQIQSDDLAGVTKLDIKYLDANNGDAEVERTSSIFRLCNNGTENYNIVDGTQIDVSDADTYSQTFSIKFTPTAYNQYYHYKLQITMKRGSQVVKTVTHDLYGRSLPEEFVFAVKDNDNQWYALPNTIVNNSNAIRPIRITVDNMTTPTKAMYAPNTTVFKGDGRYAAGTNVYGIRFTDGVIQDAKYNHLQVSTTAGTNYMWLSYTGSSTCQDWMLTTTDFSAYTITLPSSGNVTKKMGIYGHNFGYYASPTSSTVYILPIEHKLSLREATVTEWGRNSVVMAVSASDASGAKAHVENGDITETQTITPINETAAKAKNFRVPVGSIDLADLAASEGKLLYIDWLDGSGEVIATSCVKIPRIIAESRDMHRTGETTKTPWETEVHVLPGVTLTANTASFSPSGAKISDLHIYPGATLNITSGTLNANNLSLHNGWTYAGARSYDVARVYIAGGAALTKTTAAIYLNSYDQTEGRHYYPLAVPFETAVSSVDYADASLASFSTYGTHYVIKEYNGANRAENGEDNNNWVVVSDVENLIPGKGYIVTAVAVKGEALLKIPLDFIDAWTADGEKGSATYDDESIHTKNAIAVTAYSGTAATAQPRHAGWNMLGVPYMSCFHTEELPYVSIPSHDFAEYIQIDGAEADLRPGWSFFVQVGADDNMTFSEAGRRTNEDSPIYAPQRTMDSDIVKTGIILIAADGESADKLGLVISDRYTATYEVGADLEKMFGNGYTLATYSLSGTTRLAFNALSRAEASQVIPVGFRAPETGSYTFAINPRYATAGLLRLELIDYQTQEVTDLMTDTYTFTTPRTQDDSRFAIHVAFTDPGSPTPAETAPSATEQPQALTRKFVKDGCLFIQCGNRIYDATGKEVRL